MTERDSPDNVLFRVYERYIGQPETETDVYLGFGLFFAAVAFALAGLVLFVVGGAAFGIRTDAYFALAQPGYVLSMLSLPLALLAVVVLLPTASRATWAAAVGVAVTGAAAVAFLAFYPDRWFEFGTQETLLVIGTYAAGLAIVTASTGAALVAHHLARAAPAPSEIEPAAEDHDEEVTEEQVRADIEEAMASVDLTLGGVEREEHRRLEFTSDYADEAGGQLNVEPTETVSPGGVDEQVKGLTQIAGGERAVATSESTVDDETAALNLLKEQKRQDEVPTDAPTADGGILARLRERLGLG